MTKREDHEELYKIVDESSMDHHYVYHKEFFVNHLAHAQVRILKLTEANEPGITFPMAYKGLKMFLRSIALKTLKTSDRSHF